MTANTGAQTMLELTLRPGFPIKSSLTSKRRCV
jgi:hypothetical protein